LPAATWSYLWAHLLLMSPHRSGLHLHLRLRRRPQSLLTRANPRDSIPFRCDQEKSHERHLKIWGEWLRWGRWKAATATAALRECSSRICSHTTATGDKQLGKTEELRSWETKAAMPIELFASWAIWPRLWLWLKGATADDVAAPCCS